MIVTFDKDYLRELYEKGMATEKKYRFQPEVINGYLNGILKLQIAAKIEDLYKYKSLNYEILKGDKKGISSIRATKKYRIEFTVKLESHEPVVTICNILELSNHYK